MFTHHESSFIEKKIASHIYIFMLLCTSNIFSKARQFQKHQENHDTIRSTRFNIDFAVINSVTPKLVILDH